MTTRFASAVGLYNFVNSRLTKKRAPLLPNRSASLRFAHCPPRCFSSSLILSNDGPSDNWHGEYAVLLAHAGGPALAGIVVSTGGMWFDLDANFNGWQELVTRARESGLASVPDPIRSASAPLERPDDGNIDSTAANDSEGARFIVQKSSELSRPDRPVVVSTGGRLTDVADAYLIDPTVTERVIVVASLGTGFSGSEQVARMGVPNGEMDLWADALGTPLASDQVSVIALGIPEFTLGVTRVSHSGSENDEPTLAPDRNGMAWLVTASDGAAATARFWELLRDPATFRR